MHESLIREGGVGEERREERGKKRGERRREGRTERTRRRRRVLNGFVPHVCTCL